MNIISCKKNSYDSYKWVLKKIHKTRLKINNVFKTFTFQRTRIYIVLKTVFSAYVPVFISTHGENHSLMQKDKAMQVGKKGRLKFPKMSFCE